MQTKSLLSRGLRKLWALLPKKYLANQPSWRRLRHYPAVMPSDALLQQWNTSRWSEYRDWLKIHSLQILADWTAIQQNDFALQNPPRISIVTPVYNTADSVLFECVLSVRLQTYPYWQLVLVDDGSSRAETLALLRAGICQDPRIQIIFCERGQGISTATNLAIQQAAGDYVVFLDHDDRLAPEALSLIAREILADPSVDIVYSDRDMLSEQGDRYQHLFKPDWSPESLLSGNYIFHVMCYRRQLLQNLQGLRAEYDGSQDYDLILRASETQPNVRHISSVLYHWRQHSASVALNVDSKAFAFEAGLKALNATLQRRGIRGEAIDVPNFWKGTYQLNLAQPEADSLQLITLDTQAASQYATVVSDAIKHHNQPAQRYIAIVSKDGVPAHRDALIGLAAWLGLEQVGFASGKILDTQGKIVYIGMDYNRDASLMYPYRGFEQAEPGYRGVCHIIHNTSAPYPFCVVFRREIWQQLGGFDETLQGPHALLDFVRRAGQLKWRNVVVPQHGFIEAGIAFVAEGFQYDLQVFQQRWAASLVQGDPYYNPNLADYSHDMGLDI